MKNLLKKIIMMSGILVLTSSLAACPKKKTVEGIWIMAWNGDGEYHEDIGHKNLSVDSIKHINVAILYAIAKSYNENVDDDLKINIYTTEYEGDYGGVAWSQKIQNFRQTMNKYPDAFLSLNMVSDIQSGIVADLSRFAEDPAYQAIDSSLLDMMNYYGFQGGLPQYAIPAGVFVNKELATKNSIPVPDIDWTWEEYNDFVTHPKVISASLAGKYYGAVDAGMQILKVAYIEQQLKEGNTSIDITTEEFKELISYLPLQSQTGANGNGVDSWLSWETMRDGKMLTSTSDPWMLSLATTDKNSKIQSNSWDYYPRPSLSENIPNHVASVVDPVALYNACQDDSKAACSSKEIAKIEKTWDFVKYWMTDTRGWEAKANQRYVTGVDTDGNNVYGYAISPSLPIVKDPVEFDKQMDIWFSVDAHKPLKDETKFPGFSKVLENWQQGKIYGISDKTIPRFYQEEGDPTLREILDVINGFGLEEYAGVDINDPTWYDQYTAFLLSNNIEINKRYKDAYDALKQSLKSYYGWKDENFQ